MIHVYPVTPVPAPRQTQGDKYRDPPRPPVARYRAFQTELRLRRVQVPRPFHHVVFVLPMPESWSTKKKQQHQGMPHESKPDRDNLEKALLDSVFGEDAHVWDGRATKIWGWSGLILISAEPIAIVLPFDLSRYQAASLIAMHGGGVTVAPDPEPPRFALPGI